MIELLIFTFYVSCQDQMCCSVTSLACAISPTYQTCCQSSCCDTTTICDNFCASHPDECSAANLMCCSAAATACVLSPSYDSCCSDCLQICTPSHCENYCSNNDCTGQPLFVTSRKLIIRDIGARVTKADLDTGTEGDPIMTITAGSCSQTGCSRKSKSFPERTDTKNPFWGGDYIWEDLTEKDIENVYFALYDEDSATITGDDDFIGSCSMNFHDYQNTSDVKRRISAYGCGGAQLTFDVVVEVTLALCSNRSPYEGFCKSSLDSTPCFTQCSSTNCGTDSLDMTVNPGSESCVTECPENYGADNNNYCKPLDCNSRNQSSSASLPCADTHCFAQPYSRLCRTDCPQDHFIPDSGHCVLRDCSQRVNTMPSPSGYPCAEFSCFLQPKVMGNPSQECGSGCPTGHYVANYASGVCELKPCRDRTFNNSEQYPCAEEACFLQPDGALCATDCPSSHYTGDKFGGRCLLKPSCGDRRVDLSADTPCGSGCYLQPDNYTCATTCPSFHYAENIASGRCLLQNCVDRVKNITATYSCGEANCYLQPDGSTCDSVCPSAQYAPEASGICSEKGCVVRIPLTVGGPELPCGSLPCYLQPRSPLSCWSGCPSAHYVSDDNSGKCILKPDCGDRRMDSAADTPCGAGCYLQPDNYTCAANCSSDQFEPNTNGRCTFLDCEDRVNTTAGAFPCGEATCYLQPDGSCGKSCPPAHYAPEPRGVCGEKACALRSLASDEGWGTGLPCGTLPCYLQPGEAPPTLCAVGCPASLYVPEDTNGTCVLKDTCTDRLANISVYDLGAAAAGTLCGDGCFLQPSGSECGLSCPEGFNPDEPRGICVAIPKSSISGSTIIIIVMAVVAAAVVVAAVVVVVIVVHKGKKGNNREVLLDTIGGVNKEPEDTRPPFQRFHELSDKEFESIFEMTHEEYDQLPEWKQIDLRKEKGFF